MSTGFGAWSARAAHPSATIFEEEFCPQARNILCGFGSVVLPQALRRESQRASVGRCAQRSRSVKGTNCLGAAQLTVAPDKTPDPAPGGKAASILPRRTASRRLQTSSAGCTVSRVKRRAALLAAHLAASCG